MVNKKSMKNCPKEKKKNALKRKILTWLTLWSLMLPIAMPIPVMGFGIRSQADQTGLALTADKSWMPVFNSLAPDWSNMIAAFFLPLTTSKKNKEQRYSKEESEKQIRDIETQIENDREIKVGSVISLAGTPVDKNGSPINGIALKWNSSNSGVVKIISDSQAMVVGEGEVKLNVASEKSAKEISLTAVKQLSVDGVGKTSDEVSMGNLPEEPLINEQQAQNLILPENNLGDPIGQTEMNSISIAAAVRTRERAGTANYSFDLSLGGISGRGIDAGAGVTYNSRVWNKSTLGNTNVFDFNIDQNWLAPGFSVGFGSIEGYSTATGYGYLLTSSDGARHQLIQKHVSGNCTIYESTDGTFIQSTVCGIYASPTMTALFPDGTHITYGALAQNGKRYATEIRDRNGNFITIAYLQNDYQGKIAYVKDTLNRYINFHYDSTPERKLIAVSVPGFNGSATPRQTVRFYYEDINLLWQNRFQEPVTVNAPTTIKVLRHVYYPGTGTGYRYDYSPYFGVINKISQRHGMQISENINDPVSLTQSGTVTNAGTEAAWTHYNYPSIAMELGPPLTDVPKYSLRKDDWLGRTTPTVAQTSYHVVDETQLNPQQIPVGRRVTTVTAPNGTKSVSITNIKPPNDWDNGLLTETKLVTIENSQERVWSKTKMFWEQGGSQSAGQPNPRLQKIEITNDATQTQAMAFEYDAYNNQTVSREYDFAPEGTLGTELRRTETTYEMGAGWINNRLLRLPLTVKTIVNSQTVSKLLYEYDNYQTNPLASAPGVTQHKNKYDPYNPGTHQCNCVWTCDSMRMPSKEDGSALAPYCPDGLPPIRVCEQCPNQPDPAGYFRGNITKSTVYADASVENDPNASVSVFKYDVTGNILEASLSCCDLKSWQYTSDNNYAYPISQTNSGGGLQLSESATYDFNTGLVKTATDENNQTATLTYDPASLRLVRSDRQDGAWAEIEYNLSNYPFTIKTTTALDQNRSISGWKFLNGRGQTYRVRSETANGWISSDVEHDNIGRTVKTFNAYTVPKLNGSRPVDIKFSEVNQTDGLGRVLLTTLADNTTIQAEYNGTSTIVTDQAGKKRRQLANAIGQIVRVDEPDASGNLGNVVTPNQPTFYEYDGNSNLSKVMQTEGGITQERVFKYDSQSKITHERQVEATATLNSAGTKVSSGGLWTTVYKYRSDGLISERIDARGVKASYAYDGLRRRKTVSYSGETGHQTPTVTYTYDEAESGFYNNGRLTKVATAAVSSGGQETLETVQNYDYDKLGQIVKNSENIGNQTYNLEYGYNFLGQLVSEKYPSGRQVNHAVDDFGIVQNVSDTQRNYLSGTLYNSQGMLSQLNLGNGLNETFEYNDRLQMVSQSLKKGAAVQQRYDYTYGQADLASGGIDASKNNGQLGKIEAYIGANKQWSQRFGFDGLGRLSEVREYKQGDNGQLSYKQRFDYDRFGNLYRKVANNPAAGQQTPLPFSPVENQDINKANNRFATDTTYNEAGQVVTDAKFRGMNFHYDANGRQVKATKANTPDTVSVYNASGLRVATKVFNVWTFMIYDTFGKLVAEYGLPGDGPGGIKYIQQDWQGSVRTVTNSNGFVTARSDYQAFGEGIGNGVGLRSIAQGYISDKTTRTGYARTEDDEATGQLHTWWRKLENRGGRWSSPDPYNGSAKVWNPQSFNRYAYVVNDPISFIDPTGLCTFRINITGLSGDRLKAAQKEITRIFGAAGHSVVFGGNDRADADYNINVGDYSDQDKRLRSPNSDALGATRVDDSSGRRVDNELVDGTVANSGAIFTDRVDTFMSSIPSVNRHATNVGTLIGRAIAHEAGHYLLNLLGHGADLMRKRFPRQTSSYQKAGKDDTGFNFTAAEAQEMTNKWCPPQPPANNPGDSGGGGGGGIVPVGGGGGGGGYPWWYYSMMSFLAWIYSIQVEVVTVTVLDE